MKKSYVLILLGIVVLGSLVFFLWRFSSKIITSDYDSSDGFIGSVSVTRKGLVSFVYQKNGRVSLYSALLNGTNVAKIPIIRTSEPMFPMSPLFSSDGSKILFISHFKQGMTPKGVVYVVNANGGEVKRITEPHENIREAVFSADGKSIYYIAERGFLQGPGLFVRDISGGARRGLLIFHLEFNTFGMSLSPNGTMLLMGQFIYYLDGNFSENIGGNFNRFLDDDTIIMSKDPGTYVSPDLNYLDKDGIYLYSRSSEQATYISDVVPSGWAPAVIPGTTQILFPYARNEEDVHSNELLSLDLKTKILKKIPFAIP